MKNLSVSTRNRRALVLLIIAIVSVVILFCLPAYEFTSCVYTKKSGNTPVGSEKYYSVKAEAEQVLAEYQTQGLKVNLAEDVLERTNSKGETTSLVTFRIEQHFNRSVWSFIRSALPSAFVIGLLAVCLLLSALCAFTGSIGTMDVPHKFLPAKKKMLRGVSGWFALTALLCVPAFVMMNTYALSRKTGLYIAGTITEGKESFFLRLDQFLFDGLAGENIESSLSNLTYTNSAIIWLAMLCIFVVLLSAVQLRFGAMQSTLVRGLLYAFVLIVCVVTLYPYYVMFITAFRSNAETTDMLFQHLLPTKWVWSNLKDILDRNVLTYLKNSLLVAGGATLLAMLCGIPAAYSLARRKFKGKNVFLGFVIMSQMFSPVVLLIGIVQLMSKLKLNDSILGLMFINAAFNQAFAIWLLRGTFVSISPEMEQASMIDGCNTIQSLTKILLPMAAPGIVTALIFVFINAWNEYTISTVLISTASNRPITVGITQFSSFNMIEWQYLFAASLLATIPVVFLFARIEKHLVSGLTSGGVKG